MSEQTQGTPPFLMRCLTVQEWRAYVKGYDFGTIPPTKIVLHHTWKPTIADWRGAASMRGMQGYYASLGWTSAPHIYVAPDGIWLATPMRDIGIHAGTGNSGYENGNLWYSIGIEMVGNYDNQRPSGIILALTKEVIGGLAQRLAIDPHDLIRFHRDYSSKSCPGNAVSKEWVILQTFQWLEEQQHETDPVPPPQPDAIPVDSRFMGSWNASGGVWQPERLTPGYPLAPARQGNDGRWGQRFERGVAVLHEDGAVHWQLLQEILPPDNNEETTLNELVTPTSTILSVAPRCTIERATAYVLERGTSYDAQSIHLIIGYYWNIAKEGKGDPLIALAQCIHETDNLSSWWSQRPRRNPAGLGVTGETRTTPPMPNEQPLWAYHDTNKVWVAGLSFSDWQKSVRAHVGRLLAYALSDNEATPAQASLIKEALALRPLPNEYRGSSKTLRDLNGRWAVPGNGYAESIADIAQRIQGA